MNAQALELRLRALRLPSFVERNSVRVSTPLRRT